jgi:sulfoxide reductase heme-binding subunit YedZ
MRLWLWRIPAWALGLVPLFHVAKWTIQSRLGANPVEFLEHYSGDWTLRLLLVTLSMTPLRMLTGATEPIRIRRLLGLWAYFYLCLHFATYLVFDLGFSLPQLGADLVKRTYITLGFAAWLLLLPLAITSTNGWQRRLKRRWKPIHRLIYPAVLLGAIHYLWLVKADTRTPYVYLGIFLVLMMWRLPVARIRAAILRGRSVSEPVS